MTSRTNDNFRQNFWTWVDPPPPFEQCSKKLHFFEMGASLICPVCPAILVVLSVLMAMTTIITMTTITTIMIMTMTILTTMISMPTMMTILTMMAILTKTTSLTMMTISTLMSIVFVSKLEVVHKQVGGYLIPYNLQPPCVRMLEVIWPNAGALPRRSLWMMNHYSLSQSVSHWSM